MKAPPNVTSTAGRNERRRPPSVDASRRPRATAATLAETHRRSPRGTEARRPTASAGADPGPPETDPGPQPKHPAIDPAPASHQPLAGHGAEVPVHQAAPAPPGQVHHRDRGRAPDVASHEIASGGQRQRRRPL